MGFMKQKYGHAGYAIWYQLIEQLGDADFHFLDLSEETELMLLSTELMTTETQLIEVITDLMRLKVFNRYLWEFERIVFDEKFVKSIEDAYSKRKSNCVSLESLFTLLHDNFGKKLDFRRKVAPINTQSKVKESKGKKSIEGREDAFKQSITPFKETHDIEMLRSFYSYWSESNGKKMRFEMEKTWDLKRRLNRWDKNNFQKPINNNSGVGGVPCE